MKLGLGLSPYNSTMLNRSTAGQGSSKLAENSRLVVFGTSRMNYGETYSVSNTSTHTIIGETGWLIGGMTGGRFYMPPGGNKGVIGNQTDQMDTRFATDVTPLNPKVLYMDGPINDLKGSARTLSDIQTSMLSIFSKARAAGVQKIFVRNEPASNTITAGRETIRTQYNSWLNTQANTDLVVLDVTNIDMANLTYSADQVHLNGFGAYTVAKQNAPAVANVANDLTYPTANNVLLNPQFSGAGPSLPTSWLLFDNSNGATVSTTLETRNITVGGVTSNVVGVRVDVSGTYTGSGKLVNIYQQSGTTPAGFTIGDVFEGLCIAQVAANSAPLNAARLTVLIGSQSARANHPTADIATFPAEAQNYVMRTPTIDWATGTGYTCQMSLMFPAAPSTTPISASVWFAAPVLRKVPAGL